MSNGTKVVKRNGTTEPLDLNKLHVMVEDFLAQLRMLNSSTLSSDN